MKKFISFLDRKYYLLGSLIFSFASSALFSYMFIQGRADTLHVFLLTISYGVSWFLFGTHIIRKGVESIKTRLDSHDQIMRDSKQERGGL